MVDINDYINRAINQVFGQNSIKQNIAKRFQDQFSGDTQTLLDKLGSLCNCDFSSKASLGNVIPSQEVNDAISAEIANAGSQVPSDILTKQRVQNLENEMGDAPLTTTAKTVKGGINELHTNLGSTNVQVGTLGSFYECSSLTDTTPTLIATGSSTISGRSRNDQLCNNWSYSKEWAIIGASKILSDSSSTHVYVSSSSSGDCYNAIGSLMTQSNIITSTRPSGNTIPPLSVTCSDGSCSTVELLFNTGWCCTGCSSIEYLTIPALTITCHDTSCTTTVTSVTGSCGVQYTIPALTVGAVGATAGSLYALCMYALDH